jgi:microcystin-dependent protein
MADRRRNLGIPSGVVFPFAGTVAPYGYLICDGSPILKSEYPQLFLAIGTSHGVGNGDTTFNLPDYRGRFLRGVDGDAGLDLDKNLRTPINGGNSGNTVGSVQDDNNKLHGHPYLHNLQISASSDANGGIMTNGDSTTVRSSYTGSVSGTAGQAIGGDGGSESRPKNINVNYIIKI